MVVDCICQTLKSRYQLCISIWGQARNCFSGARKPKHTDPKSRSESTYYRLTKRSPSSFPLQTNVSNLHTYGGQSKHLDSDPKLCKSLSDMPRQSVQGCCQRRYQPPVWGGTGAGDGTQEGIQTLPDKSNLKAPQVFFFFFNVSQNNFPLPKAQTTALFGRGHRLLTCFL